MIGSADIAARMEAIAGRVREAAARAGRDPAAVRIVAVGKRQPAEAIDAAYQAGIRDFGENYAQELARKSAAVRAGPDLRWHFIGHLQRNKVKMVVGRVALIHAVDSEALARAIDRRAAEAGIVQPVLVAVNLGGEAQKSGVSADEAPALVGAIAELGSVRADGVMTMPPLADTAEQSRRYFRALRALRDRLWPDSDRPGELSMGTSGDFEVAVEEGATLVRVGTAIFGPRPA